MQNEIPKFITDSKYKSSGVYACVGWFGNEYLFLRVGYSKKKNLKPLHYLRIDQQLLISKVRIFFFKFTMF